MLKPPGLRPGINVLPFVALQDQGLIIAPTLEHAVFTTLNGFGGVIQVFDLSNSNGQGFIILYKDAVPILFTSDLQTSIRNHAINIVYSDFAYQLDNPAISLGPNGKVNYFVKLWPFAGTSVPPQVDAGKYPEDSQLIPSKALFKIPKDVIQPIEFGYAIQIVNTRSGLPGHFKDLPTPVSQ